MAERDKYDERVTGLLPARIWRGDITLRDRRAFYEAVAAALRESGQREDELRIELGAWQTIFQTTQLTHAQARLKKAESSVAQLKRVVQRAAGIAVGRCVCVFEADDDRDPVTMCNYHREREVEIARLTEELESHAWEIPPAMAQADKKEIKP